jgi:excinuclease ABC subunit B
VNYFVSYYDYYQPEAYIPAAGHLHREGFSRNDDLDQLRLAATSNLLSRRDTVVVGQRVVHLRPRLPKAYGRRC